MPARTQRPQPVLIIAVRGKKKPDMSNPWLTKNPFMSMWLGAANRMVASLRGQATAQAKRQINAAVTQAAKDSVKQLFETPALPRAKSKRRR